VLNTTLLGESGSPVVFCHGLFGQGKNWTAIGKALAEDHRVLLVDLPDHGRSPRSDRFDYVDYADQVAARLSADFGADDPVALVGHSMGGKVAMLVALRRPELVERLVVVDVAPVPYDHADEFDGYITAMKAIDLDALARRSDADEALRDAVPAPMVRGFLLQSLRRERDGWRWLLNLDLLGRDLDLVTGWPEDQLAGATAYEGLVLWVGGESSGYVRPEYAEAMDRWFPRNRRVTVKGAGHWVHSEQPEVFLEVLRRFLAQPGQDPRH
jgi:pimeloyl-ACP methyl ester carboxylesterase